MKQVFRSGPHPLTGEKPPVVFGHEFSGYVTEIGKDTNAFTPGDRVAVMPLISDGTCDACTRGVPNCCRQLGFIGLHGLGGGLSDAVVVDSKLVFKLPSSVTDDLGGEQGQQSFESNGP